MVALSEEQARQVRAQVETITTSPWFANAGRMQALLRHLAVRAIEGRTEDLKESVIGVELYGRTPGYDTKTDGIVRVEAHRLRARLEQYYESGDRHGEVRLRLPKGTYLMSFEFPAPAKQPASPQNSVRQVNWGRIVFGTVFLCLVVWASYRFLPREEAPPPPALRQLTADTGLTKDPVLSKDGTTLIYASDRDTDGNLLLWKENLQTGSRIRLTSGDHDDSEPWISPNGRHVAYRSERDGGALYRIPIEGGVPEMMAREGRRPRYSPDGVWILYWVSDERYAPGRIYVVPAGGGEPRRLASEFADAHNPVWSPDGKAILFCGTRVSNDPTQEHDWWVIPFPEGTAVKTGAAQRFEELKEHLGGLLRSRADQLGLPLDWVNGHLIFSAALGSLSDVSTLWRMGLSDDFRVEGQPERLTYGTSADMWAMALGNRIVFSGARQQVDIYSVELDPRTGMTKGELQRLTRNPQADLQPTLSADGGTLAYMSDRNGRRSVWLLDLQNGIEREIESSPLRSDRPIFAPSGNRIAYMVMNGAKMSVRVKDGAQEPSRELAADAGIPTSWSPDGKWLLFEPGALIPFVGLLNVDTGQKGAALQRSDWGLRSARISPSQKWIAMQVDAGKIRKIMLAPFRPEGHVSPNEWIDLSGENTSDFLPSWSSSDGLLYFVSERDGTRSIWGQRLNMATMHPAGAAFPVLRMPLARQTLLKHYRIGLDRIGLQSVAGRLVFAMENTTSNIWLAELR